MSTATQSQRFPDAVGDNVRRLRRIRHLSQVELARRLGMRPGPVNCIEKGRNLPSAKVLCKLADILEVSVDALFARPDAGYPAREPGVRYCVAEERAEYCAPQAVLVRTPDEAADIPKADLCKLDGIVSDFLAIEDLCVAQKRAALVLHIPFEPTLEGIEELATEVRRRLGVGDAVVFDYLEMLENAGLRVVFCDVSEKVESLGCYDEANSNAVIIVACGINVERQLFRLMYELGRVYCFTRMRALGHDSSVPCGRNIAGKIFTPDRMAKAFAALFLQPVAAVRATVRQLKIGREDWTHELVLRIKHRFGVSAEAFLYRLKELRLIDRKLADGVQAELYAGYKKTGFREPSGTRRVLTPNGRLGDLLLLAEQRSKGNAEVAEIRKRLKKAGVGVIR